MIILPGWSGALGAPITSAFSPASLFQASETGLWLASSDIATLFQASGGTTAVAANNDPVGYWGDKSGNNNHCIQATAGSRPLYQTSGPGVKFDGTDDVLKRAAAMAQTTGSLAIRFLTQDTPLNNMAASRVLVSAADEGAANVWFEVGVDTWGRPYAEFNAAGTIHRIVGSTFFKPSTRYTLVLVWDDTEYYMEVDGVEQNPLYESSYGTRGWFGDVAGADNFVVGGTITSAGLVRPWKGDISEVILTSQDITA